jgi:predicted nucleic acid-binding protein
MIHLVLDTNVLVSANLNDEGIEAAIVSLALNKKIRLRSRGIFLGLSVWFIYDVR